MHSSLLEQQKNFKKTLAKTPIFSHPIIKKESATAVTNSGNETSSLSGDTTKYADISSLNFDHLRPDKSETKNIRHLNSYLHSVLQLLKTVAVPLSSMKIKEYLGVDLESWPELLQAVSDNEKISVVSPLVFEYKPAFSVRSKQDLLDVLKAVKDSGRGVLELIDLKDSQPAVDEYIKELLQEKKLFYVKSSNLKDQKSAVGLFYNDLPELSNSVDAMDPSFKELWNSISMPQDDVEMQNELEKAGLSGHLAFSDGSNPAFVSVKKEKKRKTPKRKTFVRKIKLTNTHLDGIDLTQDYIPTEE